MEKAGYWKGYVSCVRITYTVIINQRTIQRWGLGSREDVGRHREMQSAWFMSVRWWTWAEESLDLQYCLRIYLLPFSFLLINSPSFFHWIIHRWEACVICILGLGRKKTPMSQYNKIISIKSKGGWGIVVKLGLVFLEAFFFFPWNFLEIVEFVFWVQTSIWERIYS